MARTKGISEDLSRSIVDAHWVGKGYKRAYPTKYGGGSIIIWACVAASRPGRLVKIDGVVIS